MRWPCSRRDTEGSANEPTPAKVGEATILKLKPSNCVALEGRIFDASGKPLLGASVHFRSRLPLTGMSRDADERLVAFDGGFVLITDAGGRFRTPKELELDREYTAYAHAKNHQFFRTGWPPANARVFAVIKLPADVDANRSSVRSAPAVERPN